jgi:hypothetical protein
MGEGAGQHLLLTGRLQNLPGAGHSGAIGNHLQVLVAKGRFKMVGTTAGDNQLPSPSRELLRHRTSHTAGRAGDQSDLVHLKSLAGVDGCSGRNAKILTECLACWLIIAIRFIICLGQNK